MKPLTHSSDRPSSLCEPPLGAHLSTPRTGYMHHGVYVGRGEVIHLRRLGRRRREGLVVKATLYDFSRGKPVCVESSEDAPYVGERAVERAASKLGQSGYSLLHNNCEHFSNWCVRGVSSSEQVSRYLDVPARLARTIQRRVTAFFFPAREGELRLRVSSLVNFH